MGQGSTVPAIEAEQVGRVSQVELVVLLPGARELLFRQIQALPFLLQLWLLEGNALDMRLIRRSISPKLF